MDRRKEGEGGGERVGDEGEGVVEIISSHYRSWMNETPAQRKLTLEEKERRRRGKNRGGGRESGGKGGKKKQGGRGGE